MKSNFLNKNIFGAWSTRGGPVWWMKSNEKDEPLLSSIGCERGAQFIVQDRSPHKSSHFEEFSNFSPSAKRVGSNPRRQFKNIEIKYKTRVKLVHELYDICFQYNVKEN
jgi:hypothetical protein